MRKFATSAESNHSRSSVIDNSFSILQHRFVMRGLPRDSFHNEGVNDLQMNMLDQKPIIFNEKQWQMFMQQLEAPPEAHSGLVELFNSPSVFE
jgi:Protein of unknown function (DUF1778)